MLGVTGPTGQYHFELALRPGVFRVLPFTLKKGAVKYLGYCPL